MKSAAPGKNWKTIWVTIIALVVIVFFAASYLLRPEALVQAATKGKAVRAVPGTVTVSAEYQMELKSEVGGRVLESALDIGKRVRRGDLVVQIDSGDIDIEIERIKNEIVAAKRKVELGSTLRPEVLNASDTLDELERKTKAGATSQAEFAKQKRLFQQLEQRMELEEVASRLALENFENALRTKEREKSKMAIILPADGVVTTVYARVGDLIGSNSPIASVISVGRTVEAKLSEENFAAVKLGQKATVRFLTYGGDHYNAVISKILPSADPTTQRYTVYLDVMLPEGRALVPGITGEVFIVTAERDSTVLIPRRALVGEHVYVVANGKLELRKVEKGYESMNQVEIVKGIKADDMVVLEQQDLFRDGERVRSRVIAN
ncbi:efflux RND transporter periplasmic adaptor subunit [Oleiharenicola lentus]|uniref:efflux RND transporter periplasmic adaptor subunit n=1 Tax=Oleiharenicola lentus TaxID=2508720 RepID=UPI003F67EEEF